MNLKIQNNDTLYHFIKVLAAERRELQKEENYNNVRDSEYYKFICNLTQEAESELHSKERLYKLS